MRKIERILFEKDSSDKSITDLRFFWGVTLIFSIVIGWYIYDKQKGLSFDISSRGVDYFFSHFEIVIRLLAGYLAAIGFVSLNHRSAQSKKQIELSENQNNFSNHFKMKEEFINYFKRRAFVFDCEPLKFWIKFHEMDKADKSSSELIDVLFVSLDKLYIYLFPSSKFGDFTVNRDVIEKIPDISYLDELLDDSFSYNKDSYVKFLNQVIKFRMYFFQVILGMDLNFKGYDDILVFFNNSRHSYIDNILNKTDEDKRKTILDNVSSLLVTMSNDLHYLIYFVSFDDFKSDYLNEYQKELMGKFYDLKLTRTALNKQP